MLNMPHEGSKLLQQCAQKRGYHSAASLLKATLEEVAQDKTGSGFGTATSRDGKLGRCRRGDVIISSCPLFNIEKRA
jgi:hypothetical protein